MFLIDKKDRDINELAEQVYDTLCGNLLAAYELPWVENAFREDSLCDRAYGEMLDARDRICSRLGKAEDEDTEIMINAMAKIQRELCLKMFHYGAVYAEEIKPRR